MAVGTTPAGSAAALHAAFTESADADVTLRLLRSRSAMVHLALMAARLGDGQVDGDHLAAGLAHDIAALSSHWTDRDVAVPTAEELLDLWTRRGFVARTLDADRHIERYQLTRGATTALAQVQSVRHDRTVATQTAMEMVIGRLSNIAVAINPDPGEHIRDIDAKIAELTARRAELAAGAVPAVDARRVFDDIRMVTSLAERMPADIIGYGEKLRENSRELLTGGLDERAGAYADALNRMFDGHDELHRSAEGSAFDAFYTLISDHRLRDDLERHIDAILAALPDLPRDQADILGRFIDRMWDEVQHVDEIRGQVYRRINTFVKGGDFLHYRALREQIGEAQRAAAAAFEHVSAGRDMGIEVPMGVADTHSIGAVSLHDGVIEIPDGVEASAGEIDIDPAALVGTETIDWQALTEAVNASVARGAADLAEVLSRIDSPRVGDVVGVWSLAQRHGAVDTTRSAMTVGAHTARGVREITVPAIVFTAPMPEPVVTAVDPAVHLLDDLTGGTPA
ncbi:hypothetical protein ASG12_00995 [Williamsia sp. Leaf354]|uniref:DUF3375 domain-containing protein n=1 Tax=Williamsia sp. Leaf354 TaxID=1736349 RepID=UPI0006F61E9D|nr:DUF3375 domain-containing protein [Williamsia sp. Leaf354]KQR99441.1 hypothetical protein ASG12_00995 [Williamsia sp. Leaf354]